MPWGDYVEGENYSRPEIDKRWGTNAGRGIFVRNKTNLSKVILAFSTPTGRAVGYEDRRESEIYLYYGMGRKGDMSFQPSENRAMRDQITQGYDLILFDQPNPRANMLRFVGQFECRRFRQNVKALDETGKVRKAIVFELTPLLGALAFRRMLSEERPIIDDGNWQPVSTS